MPNKLPKAVRDAMNSPRLIDYTETEFAIAVTDLEEMLTRVYFAGEIAATKRAPHFSGCGSWAWEREKCCTCWKKAALIVIRRMEKEAECK